MKKSKNSQKPLELYCTWFATNPQSELVTTNTVTIYIYIYICFFFDTTLDHNNRVSIIWKSDLSNKIKQDFFQPIIVSIQTYGCTTWISTKYRKKKLDGNDTIMLHALE